jgi:hypothetical protein
MALQPYRVEPRSPFNIPDTQAPGFIREATTAWTLGPINQGLFALEEQLFTTPDPAFNPWEHLTGYEGYAETLVNTRSLDEMNRVKARIAFNEGERRIQETGEWGFLAQLAGGLADPLNYLPVPISKGMGFLKGAASGAAINVGVGAVTETARIGLDPTADWNEMAYSLGAAALLGGAIGGVAGGMSLKAWDIRRGQRGMERFNAELSDLEGSNIAARFDAREEQFTVKTGNTRTFDEGSYRAVTTSREMVPVTERQTSDGTEWTFDEYFGWVKKDDLDKGSWTQPDPAQRAELGETPEIVEQRVMTVDEAALRTDFEQGKHLKTLAKEDVRTAEEYITLRQIEAVQRELDPIRPNESKADYAQRIEAAALQELKASRAGSSVARTSMLAPMLDRLNRSPVAKAIRLFADDNVLTDLPMKIAGDYGWAVRANQFGYKTPPSLLVRSMKHVKSFVEIRQAIDEQWVKYVQRNSEATGMRFMGQNVTAAAEGAKARLKNMVGGKVLTKRQFTRMAGRSVFEKEDFTVDGFTIVPEAREAAKTWVRVAQAYDKEARELGIFMDQKSLKHTIQQTEVRINKLKIGMAKWLWGGKDAPASLHPAVKVGDQLFSGDTHEDAVRKAMDELGPDIAIGPDSYGFVDNLVTDNAKGEIVPPPDERIAGAAVKIGDTVYSGANHFDALMAAAEGLGKTEEAILAMRDETLNEGVMLDGFVTSSGRYVDRFEADTIARRTGQLDNEDNGGALISEDLDGETKVAAVKGAAPDTAPKPKRKVKFRQVDDLIADRVGSMSDRQREVYDDMKADLDEVQARFDAATSRLKELEATPHRFVNQFGEPENYFARYWNKPEVIEKREQFTRLLTKWYERENPHGARERAEITIDNMTGLDDGEDVRPSRVPGLRHLHERSLDMPNSWKIVDQEFGEINAADFFETDLEVVAEGYTRGMGTKIEAARMFGDTDLFETMQDLKAHFRDTYLTAPDADVKALLARRDEYLGHVDLTRKAVLGGLKTADPWRMDNRIARDLKNYQVLTSMGRVLLTAIPEAMRVPMVNGFETAFKSLWVRMFTDLDKIKGNVEFSRQSAELADLVMDRHHARIAELNNPDPSGGGTWVERKLEEAVAPFLKLVGLTHWTAATKDWMMFAAQHKVMDLAKRVGDKEAVFKLAALGISERDAALLARMPTEAHGSIILPAVDKWTGADGRRARTLLLDAIVAESRRGIVTPSIADRSLVFQGVLAPKGKKIAETDLMSVPLQFMSYGIAASQKVLLSGLQGRDQNFYMGAVMMVALGMVSAYLKAPSNAAVNKTVGEWVLEGYENSGVGAFWFSDLNQMIERYSNHSAGLRPLFGIDPRYGKETSVYNYFDAGGPSIGTLGNVIEAYMDPEASMTSRAQAIRRAVPYNNVLWWGSVTRDIATKAGKALE